MKATKKGMIKIPTDIFKLSKLFSEHGEELYLVGGAVRDSVMSEIRQDATLVPHDFDVVTGAKPDRVIEILNSVPDTYTVLEIGKKFGIVVAITKDMPDGVEIATFRKDIGVGRRPDEVEFTTIENDVKRRDFTINALFYDIEKEEIVDFVGGLHDIEHNILRAVGNPVERFEDDPLRKMRAPRIAETKGFFIERETANAILENPSLEGVSSERIREEFFEKMLPNVSDTFSSLMVLHMKLELLPHILPFEKFNFEDILERNIGKFSPIVTLASITKGNADVKKKLFDAKYTIHEIESVLFLQSLDSFKPEDFYSFKKKHLSVTTFLSKNEILEYITVSDLDLQSMKIFLNANLSIKGDDYRLAGLQGPAIGKAIRELETERFTRYISSITFE